MTDRLAPDFVNASVVSTVSSSSTLLGSSGAEVSAATRDGRVDLDVSDTSNRRLLEDILVTLHAILERLEER